jgi:hypothetical protein
LDSVAWLSFFSRLSHEESLFLRRVILSETEWVASSVERGWLRKKRTGANSGCLESDSLDEIVQGGCYGQIKLVQAGDSVDWKGCVSGKRIENSSG